MSDDHHLTTTGGAGGVSADLDDMYATGNLLRNLGESVVGTAITANGYLADANLLSSAVLSPTTFAAFETALATALDGPDGLTAHAAGLVADGLFIQAKAAAYQATDDALAWGAKTGHWLTGFGFGEIQFTPLAVPVDAALALELEREGLFDDPQKWLVEHPDEVEELVADAPGFVSFLDTVLSSQTGLPLPTPFTTAQGAGIFASLYDQHLGSLTQVDVRDTGVPHNLAGALNRVAALGEKDRFAVERLPDGTYNVYIPGTNPEAFKLPGGDDVVQDLGTNFALISGSDNAYQEAIERALANVPSGATINLIGHSQGGIVGARVANDLAAQHRDLRITVATAGSPTDAIHLDPSVTEISLANRYDIIPRLDGTAPNDDPNHTTITGDYQGGSVTKNHSLAETYVQLARDAMHDSNADVRQALDDLHLGSGTGETTTYQMTR